MNINEKEKKMINELSEYFENNQHNQNNEEIKKKLREWVTNFVSLEAREMGYETIAIVNDENDKVDVNKLKENEDNGNLFLIFSKYEGNSHFIIDKSQEFSTPRAPVIELNENEFEYALKNFNSNNVCSVITHGFLHELRHMKQNLMQQKGVSSYIALMYAKELLIINTDNKTYLENHNTLLIEEDADIYASKKWEEITGQRNYLMQEHSFLYKVGLEEKERDEFAFDKLDEFIKEKENIDILKVFPILKKEYNEDGTKKSAMQLLKNMQKEIKEILNTKDISGYEKITLLIECKGMYFELLYRAMQKASLQEIDDLAAEYNKDNKMALFSELKGHFEQKSNKETEDIVNYMHFRDCKQEEEKSSRKKYYQDRIDFLDMLQQNQEKETFLTDIINTGKEFVRAERLSSIEGNIKRELSNEDEKRKNDESR